MSHPGTAGGSGLMTYPKNRVPREKSQGTMLFPVSSKRPILHIQRRQTPHPILKCLLGRDIGGQGSAGYASRPFSPPSIHLQRIFQTFSKALLRSHMNPPTPNSVGSSAPANVRAPPSTFTRAVCNNGGMPTLATAAATSGSVLPAAIGTVWNGCNGVVGSVV